MIASRRSPRASLLLATVRTRTVAGDERHQTLRPIRKRLQAGIPRRPVAHRRPGVEAQPKVSPSAQLAQLPALITGQSVVAAAGVQVVLLEPAPQARLRDSQIRGDLRDRLLHGASQRDGSTAKPWRFAAGIRTPLGRPSSPQGPCPGNRGTPCTRSDSSSVAAVCRPSCNRTSRTPVSCRRTFHARQSTATRQAVRCGANTRVVAVP